MMNCNEIRHAIPGLVDGALSAPESNAVKAHLKRCPECRHEYGLLRMVAGAVADLTQYQPGREFNDRILSALGHQPVARQLPAWAKWSLAAAAGTGAAWTGVVAYALGSKLTLVDALTALQLASRPKEALSALGLAAVKLGFALIDAMEFIVTIGSLALRGSSLPLQLGIASVVAFALVTLLFRRTTTLTY
jgi:anti-sigma factor RsiW